MNDYKATVLQLLADIGSADPPAGPVISTPQFHTEVLRLLGEIASGGGGGGGGGGGVLVVEYQEDEYTLNKTWQEIHDALLLGQVVVHAGDHVSAVVAAYENQSNQFAVTLFGAGQPFEAIASTKSGYPEVYD